MSPFLKYKIFELDEKPSAAIPLTLSSLFAFFFPPAGTTPRLKLLSSSTWSRIGLSRLLPTMNSCSTFSSKFPSRLQSYREELWPLESFRATKGFQPRRVKTSVTIMTDTHRSFRRVLVRWVTSRSFKTVLINKSTLEARWSAGI